MSGPRVRRARVGAVPVPVASPVALEALGQRKNLASWARSARPAGAPRARGAPPPPLARLSVRVAKQSGRDLALDRSDVPEALRAHRGVLAVALLLDAHQRGLAQDALALGKVPRREQPAPLVLGRWLNEDVAVAGPARGEEGGVIRGDVVVRRRREEERELPRSELVGVGCARHREPARAGWTEAGRRRTREVRESRARRSRSRGESRGARSSAPPTDEHEIYRSKASQPAP